MKCNRDCFNCVYEDCIEDKPKPRADYYKAYQKANAAKIKTYQKQWYEENKKSNAYFIKYLDLKRMLYKVRKDIGDRNFNYLMNEVNKLNREKVCDIKVTSRKNV